VLTRRFKMATLVINAPTRRAQAEGARSFEKTVESCIGDGYAITRNELALITPGCTVVVLDKDAERRAEGMLVRLEPNGCTENGIHRFNVHMKELRKVQYLPERLSRRGVAVI
jgi:hypothetical protein